ncbi:MAG: class I SAM-dependent methyltransferase [Acidobacteriota bacterium]
MRRHDGRQLHALADGELRELAERYSRCTVDVGTGDGRFVLRTAREDADVLVIGVDAVADGLAPTARKAQRKEKKGGAPNALFLIAAAEDLPGPLEGLADRVMVNFPWGSLMRGLVLPTPALLRGLAEVAKPGGELVALLNLSVFQDADYLRRLGIPTDLEDLEQRLQGEEFAARYAANGWEILETTALADAVPHRTTWGQKLVRGSRRRSVLLRARRVGFAPSESPSGDPRRDPAG